MHPAAGRTPCGAWLPAARLGGVAVPPGGRFTSAPGGAAHAACHLRWKNGRRPSYSFGSIKVQAPACALREILIGIDSFSESRVLRRMPFRTYDLRAFLDPRGPRRN